MPVKEPSIILTPQGTILSPGKLFRIENSSICKALSYHYLSDGKERFYIFSLENKTDNFIMFNSVLVENVIIKLFITDILRTFENDFVLEEVE